MPDTEAMDYCLILRNNLKLKNSLSLMVCLLCLLSLLFMLKLAVTTEGKETRITTAQDQWTQVRGLNDTYVFNAYFTGMDNLVRIVGVGPNNTQAKIACIYRDKEGERQKTNTGEGRIKQMLDSHGKRHNNIEILCQLTTDDLPYSIAVSALGVTSDVNLKIHYPPEDPFKVSFAVCTPALHSNYSQFTEVVQSVELDRMLGAQRFTFYYISASPEVDAVLRMYNDTGILKVVPWRLPNVDVHYFAQIASIRDCFYRNMHTSNYIVFKDLDEILLPYQHQDWLGLVENILVQDPKSGAFLFRNSFVHKLGPDVTDGMNIENVYEAKRFEIYALLKQFRQVEIWPARLRSKFIVNPLRVENVEIHQVRSLRKGFTWSEVNETLGIMLHFRKSVDRKRKTIKETSMRRFKDIIINRVDNIYFILNKHYRKKKKLSL